MGREEPDEKFLPVAEHVRLVHVVSVNAVNNGEQGGNQDDVKTRIHCSKDRSV